MNDATIEKLKESLNNDTAQAGEDVSQTLGIMFNCFGSYFKMIRELFSRLSPDEAKRLMICLDLMALELAYSYREDGWHDERKLASQRFAKNNLDFFLNDIESKLGFAFPIMNCRLDETHMISKSLDQRVVRENNLAWVNGFLQRYVTEHSTLKQAVFGGYVNGILLEEYPLGTFQPNNERGGISFPFI